MKEKLECFSIFIMCKIQKNKLEIFEKIKYEIRNTINEQYACRGGCPVSARRNEMNN